LLYTNTCTDYGPQLTCNSQLQKHGCQCRSQHHVLSEHYTAQLAINETVKLTDNNKFEKKLAGIYCKQQQSHTCLAVVRFQSKVNANMLCQVWRVSKAFATRLTPVRLGNTTVVYLLWVHL